MFDIQFWVTHVDIAWTYTPFSDNIKTTCIILGRSPKQTLLDVVHNIWRYPGVSGTRTADPLGPEGFCEPALYRCIPQAHGLATGGVWRLGTPTGYVPRAIIELLRFCQTCPAGGGGCCCGGALLLWVGYEGCSKQHRHECQDPSFPTRVLHCND